MCGCALVTVSTFYRVLPALLTGDDNVVALPFSEREKHEFSESFPAASSHMARRENRLMMAYDAKSYGFELYNRLKHSSC